MLKKWSSVELGDDPARPIVHQRRVVERLEVHRQPGAHRLARLRVAEQDAAAGRDAVDRALLAGRELHDQELRVVVGAEHVEEVVEPHRLGDAGPVRQELLATVGRRGQDPEPARAGREDGLQRQLLGPGSRARRRRPRPRRRRARAARRGRARRSRPASRSSRPCRSRAGRPPARRRARPRLRRRNAPWRLARPGRSNDDCGRTAAAPSRRATSRTASAKPGSEPRGTTWNASQRCRPMRRSDMSVPTSRTSPLAVLPERAEERCRSRAPRTPSRRR